MIDIIDNDLWRDALPKISVLIPCYRHEPTALILSLDRPDLPIEIIVLDDGSNDPGLMENLSLTIQRITTAGRFIHLHKNEGRSSGRNRLAASARADFLLFLDADMLPDNPDFLDQWVHLVTEASPAVAFGGYTLDQTPHQPTTAVHRKMALHSDCLDVEARRAAPEKYLFTSNLLIRRDVFEAEPFDQSFTGWGWEDVEWAIRVSGRFAITHVDITATHLGLDTPSALAAKYEQAIANFGKIAAMHPAIIRTYPSYKLARHLKRLPLLAFWTRLIKATALADALPATVRAFALRLYRTALYARAV